MGKDPAFLFYPEKFLTGVSDLTMEERGQYITLLCYQHQKGVVTEKTIRLTVGSVSVDVMKKFEKDADGNYYNERLREEIQKRSKFAESRRENGKKGGRKKASEEPSGKPYAEPYGKPKKNLPINININTNTDINIKDKGGMGEKEKTELFLSNHQIQESLDMRMGFPKGTSFRFASHFTDMINLTGKSKTMDIQDMESYFFNWIQYHAPKIHKEITKANQDKSAGVNNYFARLQASDPGDMLNALNNFAQKSEPKQIQP